MPEQDLRPTRRILAIPLRLCLLAIGLLAPLPAIGSANISEAYESCDRAAEMASHQTAVPVQVLMAITRTETGRHRNGETRPWPWTVNMEGTGAWFSTRAEALNYAIRHHATGAISFDIGCFQINHRWHGRAFTSIDAMFDPVANARYAAEFLADLHAELGTWDAAAGAYHSRTPEHATRYLASYRRHLAALQTSEPASSAGALSGPRPIRQNRFPLLQAGAAPGATPGSLVPRLPGGVQALFQDM